MSAVERASTVDTASSKRQTVGVVGGTGFLGMEVVRDLSARGHEVIVYNRARPVIGQRGVDVCAATCDWIVWAASSINPLIAENDADRVHLDVEAFGSFLAGLRGAGHTPRIALLSSGGTVYDEAVPPPYAETSATSPRSAYGRAKLELENRLLWMDPRGLVLRVSNAYGAGQPVAPGQGVVSHWLHAIASGNAVHTFGDLSVARDYVHASDVARAVRMAIESDYDEHPVLNLGAGHPTTLLELLDTVRAAVDTRSVTVEHHPSRSFDARSTWLDCTRAAGSLSWRPLVTLAAGVAEAWHAVGAESREHTTTESVRF